MSNIDIVKMFYEGLNSNNLSDVIQLFDKDIERVEPEGFPTSGIYNGIDAFETHLREARQTWAEGSCTPQDYQISENKILMFVSVRVKLKSTLKWVEGQVTDAFILRDEKIIFMKSFIDKDLALEWFKA